MSERVQRRRVKGEPGIPAGAIYVGRPSRFGNPFTAGMVIDRVAMKLQITETHCSSPEHAVACYRRWLDGAPLLVGGHELAPLPPSIAEIRVALAGRDLCCWCPLVDEHGQRVPCHADVLLALANPGWAPS